MGLSCEDPAIKYGINPNLRIKINYCIWMRYQWSLDTPCWIEIISKYFSHFLREKRICIKIEDPSVFCGENVCLYSSVNSLCSGRIWFPHFWGLLWAGGLKFWVKFVELCACGSARISFQFINKPSCTLQSPYTHFLDINMGGAFYSVSTVHPSIAEWKNCCREIARGILIAIEIWGEGRLQRRTSLESIFVLFVWRG